MDHRLILAWGYLLFSVTVLIVLWYYTCQPALVGSASLAQPNDVVTDNSHPFTTFILADFFIGTVPVLIWLVVEGRKLSMPYWRLYLVLTVAITVAFTYPLFVSTHEPLLSKPELSVW